MENTWSIKSKQPIIFQFGASISQIQGLKVKMAFRGMNIISSDTMAVGVDDMSDREAKLCVFVCECYRAYEARPLSSPTLLPICPQIKQYICSVTAPKLGQMFAALDSNEVKEKFLFCWYQQITQCHDYTMLFVVGLVFFFCLFIFKKQ